MWCVHRASPGACVRTDSLVCGGCWERAGTASLGRDEVVCPRSPPVRTGASVESRSDQREEGGSASVLIRVGELHAAHTQAVETAQEDQLYALYSCQTSGPPGRGSLPQAP